MNEKKERKVHYREVWECPICGDKCHHHGYQSSFVGYQHIKKIHPSIFADWEAKAKEFKGACCMYGVSSDALFFVDLRVPGQAGGKSPMANIAESEGKTNE